jgi:dTDP-4-dehydrorhamnose reductase|tara:strand:- start:3060 stop:3938 length:879 start_codon:yes stop_codon:yes gene_type:complete
MKVLIIGGDSQLAKSLIKLFSHRQINYIRTTRGTGRLSKNQIFLDFDQISKFRTPKNVTIAVVVGGVTDYGICESNFSYAHFINCVQIPSLVGQLLNEGVYVCYISSNTVFTSHDNLPKEYEIHSPSFNYASLKSKAEHQILTLAVREKKSKSLSILRLTKNVGRSTSPFDSWVKTLLAGKEITPFDDLFFAPILFNHSAEAICDIVRLKIPGMFHLSGETDISYADFAEGFVSMAKLNPGLVKRVSSKDIGVNLIYSHRITALDMQQTSLALRIKPIKLKLVYLYLLKMCT